MPRTTLAFDVNDRNARVGFDRLQRELRETETGLQQTNRTARDTQNRFVTASRSADTFGKSLGGVRGILTGLGVAVAAREIISFGAASIRAAGQIEGLKRGLEAIEGENATQRLREFNEIAKLPGLNTPQIIRYSNSLRSAGATTSEVDAIVVSFGQSIVGLGGSAADTSRAMLQLTQAFGENKISQENFSTIKELIPSFNRLAKEVYDTDGSMDALNQRFKASGQTLGQQEAVSARIQQLERSLERSRATSAALTREIELLKNGFQNLVPADATQTTANDIRQDALAQGRQFLSNSIADEERAVQSSLRKQARSYRQFSNLVSNTFINLATGRAESFAQVAREFITQSLRIVARAVIEQQLLKRLDDQLTNSKIANIQKLAAAQAAGGTGIGTLPGLGNLGNIGGLLSGGAGALGVAGLLFPKASSNLLGGIREEISGFLSNVAEAPERAFGARQQVFLKIGENETREITDLQDSLREENRV